ncbi:MAG: UDP-N-acetylglucosamine--LPS N-acetylglucosamine transferase [Roseiflexaceae bacterium]|nr:UDP-N-acetylglucosamine--LPS N-acetylglucosamine transferase [Roseiflexaceae bacterium]
MERTMPKILILHASLGTGHKSAAEALGAAFEQFGAEVRVEDTLDHCSPVVAKALNAYYLQTSEKGPKLYKAFYEASDKGGFEDAFSMNRLIGVIGGPLLRELDALVDRVNPDAIICTHQIPLQLLVARKQRGEIQTPLYVVVTDYVAHSTWFAPEVSGYFVPSELTRNMMVKRGAPSAAVCVTGIPVNLCISEEKPVSLMRQRHNLPDEAALISLFGGGIEAERVRNIVVELLEMPTPATLVVVAGRNAELLPALEGIESSASVQLIKHERIDYVDDLVAACDLVITKAGGLIVSEILARGTPMIIIDPLPGQEEWNADMVAAAGAGVQLRMAEMVPAAVGHLVGQIDALMSMRRQAQRIGRPRAAIEAAEKVLADIAFVTGRQDTR